MDKIRAWLHRHGLHSWCREVRVADHYDYSNHYIRTLDGSLIDVTRLGGEPVYSGQVVHR